MRLLAAALAEPVLVGGDQLDLEVGHDVQMFCAAPKARFALIQGQAHNTWATLVVGG